jgi:EmrB/QacA subfamily drug resistance transporter
VRPKPLILASLLLASFAINLDTTIVNVALPTLVRELHATTTQLQWVVDAYNLVFGALLLTSGSLSDRLGRKGMLLGGLAVFGLSSLAGAFTTTPSALIAARAVMGLGAAMIFPATLSVIANVFTERRERALSIGMWGASAGVAIAVGPIVGGFLLEHFSWTSILVFMAPVAAVGALLVALSVPRSKNPAVARVDVPGFAMSTAAMAAMVFTIIEAPDVGWSSGRSLVGLTVAAVLLTLFIGWERRVKAPMLDVGLFRDMRFTAASGSVAIAFFTLFGFIFLMTQYFQFLQGFSPLSTGVHLLPVAVSVAVGSVIGTRLAVRAGTNLVVAIGLLAITAFYLWVAVVITAHTAYGVIAAQMVLYGVGMGFTSAPATESIMGAVSIHKAGVGSAVNDSTRLLGGTLGVAVIGSLYASLYGSKLTAGLPARLPPDLSALAHQSVGAAIAVSNRLSAVGLTHLGAGVHRAAFDAFLHGISVGCLVAGGVAVLGAVVATAFLPAQPPSVGAPEASGVLERARQVAVDPLVPSLEPVPVAAGSGRAALGTESPVGPTAGGCADV